IDLSMLAVSATHTITYTIAGACAQSTSTALTLSLPPDAGINGSITLCSTSAAASLFNQLGGTPDAGGAWTYLGVPHGATYDPAADWPGVYTYTVTGAA